MNAGIAKGEPWGAPSRLPAEITVTGDDRSLARAVARARDVQAGKAGADPLRLAWIPSAGADFARAVGGSRAAEGSMPYDLPCDAMFTSGPQGGYAVNMAVLGVAPDRTGWLTREALVRVTVDGRLVHDGPATGMVVANGQFLRGADVVPKGHPGDGRVEVQVYAVPRRQRGALRARLRTGTHVPHPGILQTSGRRVEVDVRGGTDWTSEVDGAPALGGGHVRRHAIEVVPRAFVLVV